MGTFWPKGWVRFGGLGTFWPKKWVRFDQNWVRFGWVRFGMGTFWPAPEFARYAHVQFCELAASVNKRCRHSHFIAVKFSVIRTRITFCMVSLRCIGKRKVIWQCCDMDVSCHCTIYSLITEKPRCHDAHVMSFVDILIFVLQQGSILQAD